MSSIDVLLQAADFLERQQQFSSLSSSYDSSSGGGTTSSSSSASSRVVSLSPYFLASSSLSPPLSSASSTSSSCFGSPSGSRGTASSTDNNINTDLLSSSSPLEIKHFHKKFSPSKGLDPQVLTSKFSFSSSQSNGNASASSSSAAYHNVLYPSPSSSISSDCSNSGSGFGSGSSSGSSTKLKLKTNSHSGIVNNNNGSGSSTACSLDRMDDAKRDKALHNTLEKNRRAHLKDCFENLQNELPQYKDKKATNLAILNYTVKYIDACHRKNRDFEREKAMLLKRQNLLKQALEQLVTDIKMNDKDFDLKKWQTTSASSSSGSSYSGANDLKSDYLAKVDLQMKSSSSVNGENAMTSFASDYLDDSRASTSTASEANDYATIDSRAKRNIIHSKSSGASSLTNKPLVSLKYQRKRSSNSLNLPSINIGNIHMNNKPPVIATKIIKLDEHPTSQVKLSSRGGSGNNNRQRHYSVDESMIKSKQRKRQINMDDNNNITTEDDLLDEDDEDDEDEEFDYEYDDEDEEMVTSMDEMEDNDDSENELVINEDATPVTGLAPPPTSLQKIVKLQTFSRSISNNSNESSLHRSSPSLDTSIKSSSLNGNLENLKLVLNENTTRHSQKPILSLNASNGGAQYIITSNQNNNTSNSVTGGGNKQIQIINKSTTNSGGGGGGHSFNHPSLQVKHHPYAFTTSSNNNTQQNQHLTDSALKYQINVGQK